LAISFSDLVLKGYRGYKRGRDKAWSLAIGRSFESFGQHSVLSLPTRVEGVEGISIGIGVFVGPDSWLQTIPEPGNMATLILGDNTSIAGSVVISAVREVILGQGVLLAKNVYISDHVHAYHRDDIPIKDQGVDRVSAVHIGDGVWLGQGVVVVPGVTIGAGSVIGANSVVTSNIPERSLAVGAPARVIRSLNVSDQGLT
jgi:carbonic anhydrase/acetyltransferase-like protein (isoleucine patch superfamily)